MNKQDIEYAVSTLDLSNEEKVKIFEDAFKIHRSNVFSARIKALVISICAIALLCIQWNKIVTLEAKNKAINIELESYYQCFMKQTVKADSIFTQNIVDTTTQKVTDRLMKQYGFHLNDLESPHNKNIARRNWTKFDHKINKEAEDERKNKN